MAKGDNGEGCAYFILLAVVTVFLVVKIGAVVIPILWVGMFLYYGGKRSVFTEHFSGQLSDFWLTKSEQSKYMKASKSYDKAWNQIEAAHALAKEHGVKKNKDGSYSKRSKVGKQVNESLEKLEPLK